MVCREHPRIHGRHVAADHVPTRMQPHQDGLRIGAVGLARPNVQVEALLALHRVRVERRPPLRRGPHLHLPADRAPRPRIDQIHGMPLVCRAKPLCHTAIGDPPPVGHAAVDEPTNAPGCGFDDQGRVAAARHVSTRRASWTNVSERVRTVPPNFSSIVACSAASKALRRSDSSCW